MRRTERATTCPACGRNEPAGARWCGDCGASLAGRGRHPTPELRHPAPDGLRPADDGWRPAPDGLRPADGVDGVGGVDGLRPPEPPRRSRWRWGWLVAVVVAVIAAGVLVEPAPTDTTLLGRLDDATGRSSLLPPTDGLQLLWRRSVDAVDAEAGMPPALVDLGAGRLLLGDVVVDRATGAAAVALTAGAGGSSARTHAPRPDLQGRVAVLDDGDVVIVDVHTGRVDSRASVRPGPWTPVGEALGWVAGAAVFADADGVLGAVEPTGTVRWVGDPGWSWDGTGHATDWLVVRDGGSGERVLVVDGRDGTVGRIGPAEAVHAPVVHGDTVVWIDPLRGVDRGLGHPVLVRGARLSGPDGAGGEEWVAMHLSPTSGRPTTVQVTPVDDSVVVHYWATGDTTAAVWLDPADGRQVGLASVRGSGRTDEGWSVTAVVDGGLAHVDRSNRRIRLVDRNDVERWSIPAAAGEGLLAHGGVVLVRTPPRGTSLQSRLRAVDAATGEVLWDRLIDSTQQQQLVGVLGGHVGVTAGEWPVPLREQTWFGLDSGRRRAGPALAAEALDVVLPPDADMALLGTVSTEAGARPVLVLPGRSGQGRIIGPEPGEATRTVTGVLGDPIAPAWPIGTLADDALAVTVGAGSVVAHDPATGQERWRVRPAVALRTDRALLLGEVVVTLGVDGLVRAWDRGDGTPRWQGPDVATTVMSAGGDEVVLGTATGEVLVLDATGRVEQRLRAGTDPVEDVAVVDGRVVVSVGQDVVVFGRGTVVIDPADQVPVP